MKYHRDVNEPQLIKVLDWAKDKFPVNDFWEDDTLAIALPNHTETLGFIKIVCNKSNWTVFVDIHFQYELDYILR